MRIIILLSNTQAYMYATTQPKVVSSILKYYIRLVLILIPAVLLFGCGFDGAKKKSEAYYNFTVAQSALLLNYKTGQELVFRNQNGEQLNFIIRSINEEKKRNTIFSFFGKYETFYYDQKEIEIDILKTGDYKRDFNISFSKWPEDEQLAKNNIYTKYPDKFRSRINSFPYWNAKDIVNSISRPKFNCLIDFNNPISIMNIGNKTYSEVLTFNSWSNTATTINSDSTTRNVNIIYYDKKEGIIGFDDLDNKLWRLQN